jgi:hypothetical protein
MADKHVEKMDPPDEFPFPFPPYDIQKDFMKALFTTLNEGEKGRMRNNPRFRLKQCCGSGMFILDPNFFHPGSLIEGPKDSGSRIRIKEFKYFPKYCS